MPPRGAMPHQVDNDRRIRGPSPGRLPGPQVLLARALLPQQHLPDGQARVGGGGGGGGGGKGGWWGAAVGGGGKAGERGGACREEPAPDGVVGLLRGRE